MLGRIIGVLRRNPVCFLVAFLAVGVGVHVLIMPYSPIRWADEVMINEICRDGIGTKLTDWSMMFFAEQSANTHAWAPYWFGAWWFEFGYQLFGSLGPRIVLMVWLLVSCALLCRYVFVVSGSKWFSVLLTVLYFAHPAITYSVRSPRADIIAFTFLWAIMLLLHMRTSTSRGRFVLFAAIGMITALMLFSWATSVVLLPLVFCGFLKYSKENNIFFKDCVLCVCAAAVPALIVCCLMLLPFALNPDLDIAVIVRSLRENFMHGERPPLSLTIPQFFTSFFAFPFFYPLGILMLCLNKKMWLEAVFGTLVCLLFSTSFTYVSRMIYFLPYALIGFAWAWRGLRWRKVILALAVIMAASVCFRSLIVRTATEYVARHYRNYPKTLAIMEREIGKDVYIYEDIYDLYYIGRTLGWHQYMAARCIQRPANEHNAAVIALSKVKYFMCRGDRPCHEMEEMLRNNGFLFWKHIEIKPDAGGGWMTDFVRRHNRLSPLGPYCVWKKSDSL